MQLWIGGAVLLLAAGMAGWCCGAARRGLAWYRERKIVTD